MTGADRPVVIAITLLLSPAVFLYIDNLFHSLVTYSTSDHLGYYGRFHRGVQVVLEGVLKGLEGLEGLARGLEGLTWLWLRALVICCGGAREEDIEIRGDFVQASPPPYFVSALPSFFFTAHQRPSHRILWPLTQWSLLGMRRCEERTQTLDLYIFIYLAYIIERTWTYITIHTLFLSLFSIISTEV